jgi:hypothetical protein
LFALYWLVNHFEKLLEKQQKQQVGTSHDQHGLSPVGSDSDGHLNDSDLDDSEDLEIAGLQKTSVASAVTKDPEIAAVEKRFDELYQKTKKIEEEFKSDVASLSWAAHN